MLDINVLKNKFEEFEKTFDEAPLEQLRVDFVTKYPVERIKNLHLDEYVVGIKHSSKGIDYHTFCYDLEITLKQLGGIQGATSYKFGIFYSPKSHEYKYLAKCGNTVELAFRNIKDAIVDLINLGENITEQDLDDTIISPMYKYKILNTYYPDAFMNCYTPKHYDDILNYFNIPFDSNEHLLSKMKKLMKWKNNNELFKNCSHLKFIRFYFDCLREESINTDEWYPVDYDPGISIDEWVEILNDKEIVNEKNLIMLLRFKDNNGQGTCLEMSKKYGESVNYYNSGSSSLAKRVAEYTGCPLPESGYWPILYLGKSADKNQSGVFIWKLRDELSTALDLINHDSLEIGRTDTKFQQWMKPIVEILRTNNGKSSIQYVQQYIVDNYSYDYDEKSVRDDIDLAGEYLFYEGILEKNNVLDEWELSDLGLNLIFDDELSRRIVTKWDTINEEKRTSKPISDIDLSPYYRFIKRYNTYTKEKFLNDVFISSKKLNTLLHLLERKKNIILQGAPGVGKTFTARRLAYVKMGLEKDDNIKIIQFHQNYSYEDFVMGYRPKDDGFVLEKGVFYDFCNLARQHPDEDYFFIIDEINRGNLSKIFGELLQLIENDYRDIPTVLAYNKEEFSVPKNIFIIGMMNTADRSLALIDYALRRRFAFVDMEPEFNSIGFKTYQKNVSNEKFDKLISVIKELNEEIKEDHSLGKGFCISHSYFITKQHVDNQWIEEIIEYDILPTLNEYWFDNKTRYQRWETKLKEVINE